MKIKGYYLEKNFNSIVYVNIDKTRYRKNYRACLIEVIKKASNSIDMTPVGYIYKFWYEGIEQYFTPITKELMELIDLNKNLNKKYLKDNFVINGKNRFCEHEDDRIGGWWLWEGYDFILQILEKGYGNGYYKTLCVIDIIKEIPYPSIGYVRESELFDLFSNYDKETEKYIFKSSKYKKLKNEIKKILKNK